MAANYNLNMSANYNVVHCFQTGLGAPADEDEETNEAFKEIFVWCCMGGCKTCVHICVCVYMYMYMFVCVCVCLCVILVWCLCEPTLPVATVRQG